MAFKRRVCTDFDLSDGVVARHRTQRIANAKIANARWAVRRYVKMLRTNNLAHLPVDAVLAKGAFRQYGVHPALLEFAVRETRETLGQ